jgi:serine-type D-Ala-D-Ala carboxypeptidase/endopeptidase (penicillin-binding protein 4)
VNRWRKPSWIDRKTIGVVVLLALLRAGALGQQATPAAPETLAALQTRLSNHINQPRFAAAAWGIKIVSLETGKTLFEHNAGKLLKPASNAKLFTAALALDRLGPTFRIKTSLYARQRPNAAGLLNGDLIVYGRGDPSLSTRFDDGDFTPPITPLLEALVKAGVKRIQGDLIGDESFFRGPRMGSGWTWDDLQYDYGAEVSALSIQDNVVGLTFHPGQRVGDPCRITAKPATAYLVFSNRTETVAADGKQRIEIYRPLGQNIVHVYGQLSLNDRPDTGTVTVHNPALWLVTILSEAMAQHGIGLSGRLRTIDWRERELSPIDYSSWAELGVVESHPVEELVRQMMKSSQNLYAQLLLLQVATRYRSANPSTQTSEEAGLAELKKFLREAGVSPAEVLLEEGSGLSRGGLVTPNAIVRLLQFMNRHRYAEPFREALPVAGIDGTLRNRLKQPIVAGKVRAKTGTLMYVNTLSGYVSTAAGQPLAFSILLNNYSNAEGKIPTREEIDAIVLMLAN